MKGIRTLQASAVLTALLLVLPLLYVLFSWLNPDTDTWQHLNSTVLSDYIINSLLLAVFSGLGAIILGAGSAYLITRFEFFGRKLLQTLLLLPLAMPAYIIAYTYTGMFDVAGPVQNWLRDFIEIDDSVAVLPDVRNLTGAIVMLSLVLYPYVYILTRTALKQQPQAYFDISSMSQRSGLQHFLKIELPLIRPAILTGASLVMMEALADYGTVAYFGVSTFSTGIYRTWFGMGNPMVAAQLASILCLFVFIVLSIEQYTRRDHRQYQSLLKGNAHLQKVSRSSQVLLFSLCALPVVIGFIIPLLQLLYWAVFVAENDLKGFSVLLLNSFEVAAIAAIAIVSLALMYSWLERFSHSKRMAFTSNLLSLSYALPGIVIAVGVIAVGGSFDKYLNQLTMTVFEWRPGLVISGSISILIFAYAVRYLSVALQNTRTGFSRISNNIDQSALLLNHSNSHLFSKIHIPLLSSSILSAALLVFVDVLKELPATLVLRPFNFNTLAVRAYELASDERLIDAALPAVSIILVGLLPVIILMCQLERSRH